MLIEFSVENFRSIAERQTISMVAGTSSKRSEKCSFSTGNVLVPDCLRSIGIFGPNGAGKSSLVEAMGFLTEFVISSAKDKQFGEKIEITPFKLDTEFARGVSEFEIIFIHKDTYYQYGFQLDKDRVWGEWLFYRPNKKRTTTKQLFYRQYLSDKDEYQWAPFHNMLRGRKEFWKDATRDNALFLSTAVQNGSKDLQIPFEWIQNYFRVITSSDSINRGFTAYQCQENAGKKRVLDILTAADTGILDLEIGEKKFDPNDLPLQDLPKEIRDRICKDMEGKTIVTPETLHRHRDSSLVSFDLDEESDGTQAIFALAGPWLDVLENGYTLVVDELHNNLHPHVLKFLVNMFHDPELNKNGAQLIFTSHETSVMAKNFIHRDQIWFVNKDDSGASNFYPLSDFEERGVNTVQKSYLDGRYGAVPNLGVMPRE